MNKDQILAQLRAHESELKAAGVEKVSIFGSSARGEATDSSDVDLVVRLSPESSQGGFAYFGRLEALTQRLKEILGRPVDIVTEPVRKERLRRIIERDSAVAF
jgi:predicted nucleotidyltransferase